MFKILSKYLDVVLISILPKNHAGPVEIVSEYDQEIPQSQTADNPLGMISDFFRMPKTVDAIDSS